MLGGLDPKRFLEEYWQRKPLLIRQALPGFHDPLSPEELAGLACEEGVEARLVLTEQETWRLQAGPLAEEDFTRLPGRDWTVLVQAVDHYLPEARELLRRVDFLPSWRVDDLMVSFAAPGGGVGPHFDYYDVFILQGQGRRRWRLGQRCDSHSPLDPRVRGLKILRDFEPIEEYLLEAGDLLYIPPGLAHHGISLDDSLSYSIGFRAPALADILGGFVDTLSEGLSADQRYGDAGREAAGSGEIDSAALDRLADQVARALDDKLALASWFGRHVTEARYPEQLPWLESPLSEDALQKALAEGLTLQRNPASRFAWLQRDGLFLLFADGEEFRQGAPAPRLAALAALLDRAGEEALDLSPWAGDPHCLRVLTSLYNQGSLLEAEEEEE